jgi:hypothetical protein
MQDDSTTQEIEERLSERLLGNETENEYAESNINNNNNNNNNNAFRIDGSGSNHVDFSATAIMEGGGDFIVDSSGSGGFGGPLQPEYRDAPFALAFLIHLGVIFFLAVTWGFAAFGKEESTSDNNATNPPNSNYDYDFDDDAYDYKEDKNNYNPDDDDDVQEPKTYVLLLLALLTCAISIGISALSLRVMMHHAETLIQASLIGSCGFMVVLAVLFLIQGIVVIAAGWAVAFLLTAWYARRVWDRIPFASSNLRAALSAIQTNGGICAVAYGISGLAVIWTIVWGLAFVGVALEFGSCDAGGVCSKMNVPVVFFMVLSFYWTIQVFQNVLHVTVSGVVGTWWFAPHDALSVFSPAIVDSFRRATTYSFGSICMGSLLVSIVQTLETMVRSVSRYNRGGLLRCVFECILRLLARIAVYFNRWAYCYVGLYGFDYISSGKKAMELFQAKGWTTIITDNLVHRSLRLVAVVVGALSGFLGMLIGMAAGYGPGIFVPYFFISLSMANILMNVVLSAVDTVIVAFAEAPAEFQTHHPALSNNMIQKWRQVFPDECGF